MNTYIYEQCFENNNIVRKFKIISIAVYFIELLIPWMIVPWEAEQFEALVFK